MSREKDSLNQIFATPFREKVNMLLYVSIYVHLPVDKVDVCLHEITIYIIKIMN